MESRISKGIRIIFNEGNNKKRKKLKKAFWNLLKPLQFYNSKYFCWHFLITKKKLY